MKAFTKSVLEGLFPLEPWNPTNYFAHSDYLQFSRSVVSDSLRPHELQHTRPPCSSPSPGVHSDSRPSGQWCHPAISSSVIPFSSCPQSLPASESFPMSQLFSWGGQSTGVSALASLLPKNTQDLSIFLEGRLGGTSLRNQSALPLSAFKRLVVNYDVQIELR